MNHPVRLHRFELSGHCHRVELFLSLLGVAYERVEVDLRQRAQKRPEFLTRNPFGQVPVLEDEDVTLFDSNAILIFLALKYDRARRWLPEEPAPMARVQQWLSVAAGPLAAGPGAARLVSVFGAPLDHERAKDTARELFTVLDAELGKRTFLAGLEPTLADVALYSYSALAPEGGVDMLAFANVRAWLSRVEALPGFLPVERSSLEGGA
jgi:glutathione S-transferase